MDGWMWRGEALEGGSGWAVFWVCTDLLGGHLGGEAMVVLEC